MADANPVRLLILGLLAGGPLHGHQIRRAAEQSGASQWAGVNVGGLYGMLHRLEAEGLVAPVRTEQAGNRPQRTVYAITEEGRAELAIHRDRALTQPVVRSTTVEVALKWPAGLDQEALEERLSLRRSALAATLRDLEASREMHLQEGHLSPASIAGYRRAQLHLEAELAWQDELQAMLPAIARGDDRDRPGPTPERPAEITTIRSWRGRRSSAS